MKRIQDVLQCNKSNGKYFKVVHHEKNRGLSAARNTGLENASGKFLFFLDSDDTISPTCIEKHKLALSKSGADFSIGDIHLVGGRSIHICQISPDINQQSPLISFLHQKWTVSACNKLYKTDLIKNWNLHFKENLLFEDILWSFCLAQSADNICIAKDAIYNYNIRENSITRKKNRSNKINSMIYIIQQLTQLGAELPRNEKKLLLNYLGRLKFNTALLLLNYDGINSERKAFYLETRQLPGRGLFNKFLSLDFLTFRIIFNPLYSIYKYLTSIRK